MAKGDGPRNFELRSSDDGNTCSAPPLSYLPHQREEFSLDRFNACIVLFLSLHGGSSVTPRLEPVTPRP
ncbi:hypothetical protein TNCV_230681 [Trichonephila clavipes]|nr:hypothetical protein TNCV_230681 [Trichonephila clavipes]